MTRTARQALATGFLLLILIAGGAFASYDASQYARCQSNNDFRKADQKRWDFLLQLAPPRPDATPEQQHQRSAFVAYVKAADVQKNCSLL